MNYDEIQAQKAAKDEAPLKTLLNTVKGPKKETGDTRNETEKDFARMKSKPIAIDSRADIFKYITIAIAVIGFVAGIICGNAFPISEIEATGLYTSPFETTEKFNTVLMLTTWIGTAITAIGTWAIYCILEALDNLLLEAKRVKSYIEFKIDKENQ
ncbi:MAG: hypothetical protein J6R66_04470 [Clostridia bacterium]|nr:hypothetical protein [Clostridia bacterium]